MHCGSTQISGQPTSSLIFYDTITILVVCTSKLEDSKQWLREDHRYSPVDDEPCRRTYCRCAGMKSMEQLIGLVQPEF